MGDSNTYFTILRIIGTIPFGIPIFFLIIPLFILYRFIQMISLFSKFKYNLLIILILSIVLNILYYFNKLSRITMASISIVYPIPVIIFSYFPLSNNVKSNANSTITGSNNNASKNKN